MDSKPNWKSGGFAGYIDRETIVVIENYVVLKHHKKTFHS